jgi:hypothetical protein
VTTPQVLYVDFNDTDARRNVIALRGGENRRADVERGDLVELRDDDGYHVSGVVARVTGKEIVVAPDWATWWNPDSVRMKQEQEPASAMVTLLMDAVTASTESLVPK